MKHVSSKDKAQYRKAMAEKGYSRIAIYAPTNAKELRAEIIRVTSKMIAEYEKLNPPATA